MAPGGRRTAVCAAVARFSDGLGMIAPYSSKCPEKEEVPLTPFATPHSILGSSRPNPQISVCLGDMYGESTLLQRSRSGVQVRGAR